MEIIFTEGIFKGWALAAFQKISAVIFALSLLLGYYFFKRNKSKPYKHYWILKIFALPIVSVLVVAFTLVIYDAPVQVINQSTGRTVQAKNIAEGKKILNFVNSQEDKAFLSEVAKELTKNS